MLKNMVSTTQDLLAVVLVIGMALAYMRVIYGTMGGRIMRIGTYVGLIAAFAMAILKNATNKIDTGGWNMTLFEIALVAFVVFLIVSIGPVRKKLGMGGELICAIALSLIVIVALVYRVPDVLSYLYTNLVAEKTVLSTAYIYKFIGWLAGVALTFVICIAVYKGGSRLNAGLIGLLTRLVLLVNALRQGGNVMRTMLARRMIPSNHTLFTLAKISSNYDNAFVFVMAAFAAVIAVVLLIRSLHVNEPYRNPAEHRKIKAKWIKTRRWSWAVIITLVLAILNLTAVNAYANRAVELSPVEEPVLEGDQLLVTADRVSDGHLHRFGYTTENGVEIRFIVIQKPNSSAYGIGLDACDICGETGYYEKDGQVVCKLCDVVMNVNTIGFKGGCNPIVIDYTVDHGDIYVPIASLLPYEAEFK